MKTIISWSLYGNYEIKSKNKNSCLATEDINVPADRNCHVAIVPVLAGVLKIFLGVKRKRLWVGCSRQQGKIEGKKYEWGIISRYRTWKSN